MRGLNRSACAVPLFGHVVVLETHTLWYTVHHCCLTAGLDASSTLGIWHFPPVSPISTPFDTFCAHFHHIHSFLG